MQQSHPVFLLFDKNFYFLFVFPLQFDFSIDHFLVLKFLFVLLSFQKIAVFFVVLQLINLPENSLFFDLLNFLYIHLKIPYLRFMRKHSFISSYNSSISGVNCPFSSVFAQTYKSDNISLTLYFSFSSGFFTLANFIFKSN